MISPDSTLGSANADDGQLRDLEPDGTPVTRRIGTPLQAQTIAARFITGDVIRAQRRVKVAGNVNGNAPNSAGAMQADGRDGESNINWRMAKGELLNAWTPYFDLTYQVPCCIDGDLDTGNPVADAELMAGFARAFHKMIFGWENHAFQTQLRDWQMILHGVGTVIRPHAIDWRPETVLVSNVYVPDRMRLDFTGGGVIMLQIVTEAEELWEKMQSGDQHWNHKAVKKLIMLTMNANQQGMYGWKWDFYEAAFKNGDIYLNQNITKEIMMSMLLSREMDGTISMLVVRAGQGNATEFLYEYRNMFKTWQEAVNFFPFDIGADGSYHSVKGLGTEVYPFATLDSKVNNSLADLATNGIMPMWQMNSGAEAAKVRMLTVGSNRIMPAGVTLLPAGDFGKGLSPALELSAAFKAAFARNTGSYSPDVAAPTVDETAKAAMLRAHARAKMTQGAYNRHYVAMDRDYRETWRRATNPGYKAFHPGAEEALIFQAQCYRLCDQYGVKHSTLQAVTNVRAQRDIGLGNPALRIEIASALMDPNVIDRLPPTGQTEAIRMFLAAYMNFHSVDALMPPVNSGATPTIEDSIAAGEDNALAFGGEVQFSAEQNAVIHLNHHVPSMEADAQALQQGADMRQIAGSLNAKGIHAHQHLDVLKGNPTKKREYAAFGERLRVLAGLADHLQQNIDEQDAAAAQQPQPGQPSPEELKVQGNLQLKAQKQAGDHQLKVEKTQQELELKAQLQQAQIALDAHRTGADIALSDASTASEIHRKNASASAATSNGK